MGSIAKDSLNRKLAEHLKNRYKDKFEMEILTMNDLLIYNQDAE
ncbi:hypothetical protein [Paenibacillus algorifonticola]